MTKEEIIDGIKKQKAIINTATREIETLSEQLLKIDDDDWDWITVREGAMFLRCSVNLIYTRINNSQLSRKCINSKTYVRKSELKKWDDSIA